MYMRDLRKPLELSDEDLQKLIDRLEVITDTKFNATFADQINNFIGILREKNLIELHIPKNKQIKRELEKLKNALCKASDIQDSQISGEAEMFLFDAIPGGTDTYIQSTENIVMLTQACKAAIENLSQKLKPKASSFAEVKQAMATELARELDSFGIKISAYRDGVFEKCVRELFSAFNGQASGKAFKIYVADDLFQIIKTAKKDYKVTERFVLLKFR